MHRLNTQKQSNKLFQTNILMWEDNFLLAQVLLWLMNWYIGQKKLFF